jgi:hypothetical protein
LVFSRVPFVELSSFFVEERVDWRLSTFVFVMKPRPAVNSVMTIEITRRILAIKKQGGISWWGKSEGMARKRRSAPLDLARGL